MDEANLLRRSLSTVEGVHSHPLTTSIILQPYIVEGISSVPSIHVSSLLVPINSTLTASNTMNREPAVQTPTQSTSVIGGMSGSPQPRFFVVRSDGSKTPLVPIDELPPNLHILDVPTFISDAQTQGMVSLGLMPRSQSCYSVRWDEESPTSSDFSGHSTYSSNGDRREILPINLSPPDIFLGGEIGLGQKQYGKCGTKDDPRSALASYRDSNGSFSRELHANQSVNDTQVSSSSATPRNHL